MCGRYTIIHNVDAIAERFGVRQATIDLAPQYNVAPSQGVPIITEERGERLLQMVHWGLVPFWARDPEIGSRLINARAETLAEKASFKHALSRRRCLVPADGFYEWQPVGAAKQPYYIRLRDGELFAFAGLWEQWESPDGSPLRSCAIVTVEPNTLMAPIHSRMPAILSRESESVWLTGQAPPTAGPSTQGGRSEPREAALLALLKPYPPDAMEAYAVTRHVNSPRNQDAACIAPAS